jgi:hypothetical protein
MRPRAAPTSNNNTTNQTNNKTNKDSKTMKNILKLGTLLGAIFCITTASSIQPADAHELYNNHPAVISHRFEGHKFHRHFRNDACRNNACLNNVCR